MKRWLKDTLFKRLFVLMWIALVASQYVAFTVVGSWWRPGDGYKPESGAGAPHLAVPGQAASGQGAPGNPSPGKPAPGIALPGAGPAGSGLPAASNRTSPTAEAAKRHEQSHRPPALALLLDHVIQIAFIGLAAWIGARWLTGPVRRLVRASRQLTRSIGHVQEAPLLDERRGTVEVREAAQVFNAMSRQLNEQFRSRGLLMAALSHDLKTPLTRMRVRLETLENDPVAQRCIADIHEMDSLLQNSLQLFRDSHAQEPQQATDVFALVQSVTDDLVEQGAAVVLDGQSVVITSQPLALRRVLTNLLQNALHYGHSARVSVQRHEVVEILIDDDGPGIPEAELDMVFQPFFRSNGLRSRNTGGAGLGLFIARDLVRRLGGDLTLHNRAEGGLRAVLRLPLSLHQTV